MQAKKKIPLFPKMLQPVDANYIEISAPPTMRNRCANLSVLSGVA
jgi:hypothetical protein